MTVPHQKIVVTRGGTDYQLQDEAVTTDVLQVENGVWQATVQANDYETATYLDKVQIGDVVKIYMDYTGVLTTQVFGGWVSRLNPSLTGRGEICGIGARGYGVSLLAMRVGQEYGSESVNPTINTVQEIIADATVGIVDKWVEKVLNTATNSGYTVDTTKVADVTSDFRYIYFAFEPAFNCINDLLELSFAGGHACHWIVYPDGTTAYLCLATVGNHENPPADVWSTWFNTNQAGSTIEVKKENIATNFTKLEAEANYVLYYGKLKKPPNEIWTENSSGDWGTNDAVNITLSDDNTDYNVGSYSLQATVAQLRTTAERWYYPSGRNLSLDVTKMGGRYNIPTINFYAMYPAANPPSSAWQILLRSSAGNEVYYDFYGLLTAGKWLPLSLPVGTYANEAKATDFQWTETGTIDWTDIDSVEFGCNVGAGVTAHCHIDGLHFSGWILRGARDDTKIGTQKAKIGLVVDDVAKDDTVTSGTPGTTDLGTMAQLAKAQLYRAITTPVSGEIVIAGNETILPGQKAHIHASKDVAGSFDINTDMRILKHRLHFGNDGFLSYLALTDDLTNSIPRDPTNTYNQLLKAVNPDFQIRDFGSLKAREIDITQAILSENYST